MFHATMSLPLSNATDKLNLYRDQMDNFLKKNAKYMPKIVRVRTSCPLKMQKKLKKYQKMNFSLIFFKVL